jgi:hypothetical protein
MLTRPAIQYDASMVAGVLLVDPETGAITHYDQDKVPEWVDRVVPESIATASATWWGRYGRGWWNSWTSMDGVMEPTDERGKAESMWLIWGQDGQSYWFSGMTSVSVHDQALTGLITTNARTGRSRYCPFSGANEDAVLQAVNAAVSNFRGYHGTDPVLYNIYGEPTWAVPVTSEDHIFQRLALVRASNLHVALGADRASALREYRKLITISPGQVAPGEEGKLTRLTVKLDRVQPDVQNGATTYYLYSKEYPTKIFSGTSALSPKLPLARAGDRASIAFLDTREEVLPLIKFDLEEINLGAPAKGP